MFPESMEEMYIGLLEKDQAQFREIFTLFANPKYKTMLFHCTAGKDRTGLTAMLLLGLAGVNNETIIEDYAWSQHLGPPILVEGNLSKLPQYLFESQPETMRAAIDYLEKKHGSIRAYLSHIGVDSNQMRIILEKLFV